MARKIRKNGPRPAQVLLRCLVAFAATFGCVQLWARTDGARLWRPDSGPLHFPAVSVSAPRPGQLTSWSYYVAGTLSREDWALLTKRAVGIRRSVNQGHFTWVDTVAALESHFFEVDDRLACGAQYGMNLESSCRARFDIGIQRQSATDGRIAYSRGAPLMEERSAADQSACGLFIKCMAHSKLGGVVPLPEADWSEVVVYQLVAMVPPRAKLRDPENLRVYAKMYAEHAQDLRTKARLDDEAVTPYLQVKLMRLDDQIRYFHRRADELEGQDAP